MKQLLELICKQANEGVEWKEGDVAIVFAGQSFHANPRDAIQLAKVVNKGEDGLVFRSFCREWTIEKPAIKVDDCAYCQDISECYWTGNRERDEARKLAEEWRDRYCIESAWRPSGGELIASHPLPWEVDDD